MGRPRVKYSKEDMCIGNHVHFRAVGACMGKAHNNDKRARHALDHIIASHVLETTAVRGIDGIWICKKCKTNVASEECKCKVFAWGEWWTAPERKEFVIIREST